MSALCVHIPGKKRAIECSAHSWFAIVSSFIDAAHVNTGLKNAFGQLIAADSRKSDSGAQGCSGGSLTRRCGSKWVMGDGVEGSHTYVADSR